MAVDVIGRFYAASAAGPDALASTSAGLYSDDSVRKCCISMAWPTGRVSGQAQMGARPLP